MLAPVTYTGLAYHPFAKLFPPMRRAEFDEFVANIQKNGLREKITLYQGAILDGIHRYRACLRLKIEPPTEEFEGDDDAALDLVISKNIHRRHLKPKEKGDLIAKLLKAQPEKSDRQISETVKVDHKTVAAVRAEQEARGEIPHVETRTDTKGRKQPSKRKKRPTVEDFKRNVAAKKVAVAPAMSAKGIVVPGPTTPAQPIPDELTTLLLKFARFVLDRATVSVKPPDYAEWKELLGRVRATGEIVS
jgi:ParB-like chromosome segregation protein Spo0J